MIKKFKNFDADGFINKKKALKEALGGDIKDTVMESPEIDPDVNVDEIITGTPVYENPYLLKISNICVPIKPSILFKYFVSELSISILLLDFESI